MRDILHCTCWLVNQTDSLLQTNITLKQFVPEASNLPYIVLEKEMVAIHIPYSGKQVKFQTLALSFAL